MLTVNLTISRVSIYHFLQRSNSNNWSPFLCACCITWKKLCADAKNRNTTRTNYLKSLGFLIRQHGFNKFDSIIMTSFIFNFYLYFILSNLERIMIYRLISRFNQDIKTWLKINKKYVYQIMHFEILSTL